MLEIIIKFHYIFIQIQNKIKNVIYFTHLDDTTLQVIIDYIKENKIRRKSEKHVKLENFCKTKMSF